MLESTMGMGRPYLKHRRAQAEYNPTWGMESNDGSVRGTRPANLRTITSDICLRAMALWRFRPRGLRTRRRTSSRAAASAAGLGYALTRNRQISTTFAALVCRSKTSATSIWYADVRVERHGNFLPRARSKPQKKRFRRRGRRTKGCVERDESASRSSAVPLGRRDTYPLVGGRRVRLRTCGSTSGRITPAITSPNAGGTASETIRICALRLPIN